MAVDPMHAENEAQDVVNISNLTFTYPQRAGRNCWGTQAHQPMIVNARIVLSKPSFSTSDEDTLASHYSMDYAATTKRMTNLQSPADSTWVPVPELCVEIAGAIQSTDEGKVSTLKIDISLPKGTMLGSTVIVSMVEDAIGDSTSYFALRFEQLTCPVMIGLRDYERTRKQPIVLDVDVTGLWNDEADLYVEFEQTLIEVRPLSSSCTSKYPVRS